MVTREDIESFLDRLTSEGVTTKEVEPGLWLIRPGGQIDFDVVCHYNPPVVVLRVKVMDLPADEVIDTMGEIGHAMDGRYRETAGGGHAAAPTGPLLPRERPGEIRRADV